MNSNRKLLVSVAFAAMFVGIGIFMFSGDSSKHEDWGQERSMSAPGYAENDQVSNNVDKTTETFLQVSASTEHSYSQDFGSDEVISTSNEYSIENEITSEEQSISHDETSKEDVVIDAYELFDDGTLNLENLSASKLAQGRLFKNELSQVFNASVGEELEFNILDIHETAVVTKNKMNKKGNRTAVLDFEGKDHAFILIYQSAQTGTLNGEMFVDGKHYSYIANQDVGVFIDMQEVDALPK